MNRNPRILLVDDEEELLEIMSDKLEMSGLGNIITATNGKSAIAKLAATGVDLVISDVRMPFVSGLELMDQLKSAQPELPIILVTGFADITEAEALDRGAFEIIEKPIPFDKLVKTINGALQPLEHRIQSIEGAMERQMQTVSLDKVASQGMAWGHRGVFLPTPEINENWRLGDKIAFEFIHNNDAHRGVGSIRWFQKNKTNEMQKPGLGIVVEAVLTEDWKVTVEKLKGLGQTASIPIPR